MLQLELSGGIQNILKQLLLNNYKKYVLNPFDQKKKIGQEIDRINVKLSIARNKLLAETIDDEEYLDIKKQCKNQIESLEEQLSKDGSDTQNQYRKVFR